jgi:2,3,4,5-tetrahydropyridine-2-carboxylate N-succinyltransferase
LKVVETTEEFKQLVEEIKKTEGYKDPIGFGICRIDEGQLNPEKVLQAVYPMPNWNENFGSAAIFIKALLEDGRNIDFTKNEIVLTVEESFIDKCLAMFNPYLDEAEGIAHKNVQIVKVLKEILEEGLTYKIVFVFEDVAPESVEAVYLKLYALSQEKAELRSLNLNGAFGLLHNVAWCGNAPIELDWLRHFEVELKMTGEYPVIDSVDKFPRYLQHVIPADNTRVLDSSKVRMGARLAAGTTVMPGASYINFNAGTLGPVMVEGRISSSAIVGSGSDVGGGASILGVLSGTDGNPISIGENTLLGANSVTGTPLGDGCIIDAGITILAGTKVTISETEVAKLKEVNADFNPTIENGCAVVKGADFASLNGVHFRQDSKTGQVVAKRSTREVKLNSELH